MPHMMLEYMMGYTFICLFFAGVVLDVFLSIAVVALYYSFLKRLCAYYKVTKHLTKALKKNA
ncbi:hypothetical protein GCM10023261_14110 [Bartonella jaculi]|uniref:Uncharacterized protein n=1 Tax=Bartonella jaculi TaxID=686226 RepID=A0ABP9NA90_9HYPH